MAEKQIAKQSQLGVPIGDKTILGELTSYTDGTAKWTYAKDINPLQTGLGDRSTFTLEKKEDGTWSWSPTTSTSISNLAQRENLTVDQVNKSLYVKSGNLPTSQTQAVLNAGNATNLGIDVASKLGVPGSKGTTTTTGVLPGEVSGAFAGQGGATQDPQKTEGNPQDFNQTLENLKIGDKEGGVRGSYGDHRYPIDADFGKQDCIKFLMYRYKPKKVELTSDLATFSGSNKGSSMGTVTLPIQPSITDTNVVSWGENTMDAISAAGSAIALSAIKGGAEGASKSTETAAKGVKDYKGDIQKAIAASFAGSATGSHQGFLTRSTGAILNNNLELLFQGPSLRSFTFTFSLSAREEPESKMIRNIIRFFKQGMSVKRSASSLFLQTPNIFDIEYLHNGKEHPYINQIKTCVLQNFTVNYTPAGNYATYEDGAMTQYDLTLTFGEIEPLFDDDYPNDGDATIGY
jgi:hypothetical protein